VTGTDLYCLHTNQSQSYLNHLVLYIHIALRQKSCHSVSLSNVESSGTDLFKIRGYIKFS